MAKKKKTIEQGLVSQQLTTLLKAARNPFTESEVQVLARIEAAQRHLQNTQSSPVFSELVDSLCSTADALVRKVMYGMLEQMTENLQRQLPAAEKKVLIMSSSLAHESFCNFMEGYLSDKQLPSPLIQSEQQKVQDFADAWWRVHMFRPSPEPFTALDLQFAAATNVAHQMRFSALEAVALLIETLLVNSGN